MRLTETDIKTLKSIKRSKKPIVTLVKLYKKNPSVTIEIPIDELRNGTYVPSQLSYKLSSGLDNNDEATSEFNLLIGTFRNRMKIVKSFKSRKAFKSNVNQVLELLK